MYVHLVGLIRENKLIKIHRIINFKTVGGKPLGRPKCRRDDDIKINLKELSYKDMDWIICNRDKWYALLTIIMNFRVP
jgi:hypothetical protein